MAWVSSIKKDEKILGESHCSRQPANLILLWYPPRLVRDFQHDGAWDYQNPPPGTEAGSDLEGYFWWNSNGIDKGGCKTEHITPDPRPDTSAYIQGSTCGYFGHLYINDVVKVLETAAGELPTVFDGTYYVYRK